MKLAAHRRCALVLMQLHAIDCLRPQFEHLAKRSRQCGKTMARAMRLRYLMELQARGMYGCEP